jgi:hypothetical protein
MFSFGLSRGPIVIVASEDDDRAIPKSKAAGSRLSERFSTNFFAVAGQAWEMPSGRSRAVTWALAPVGVGLVIGIRSQGEA